MCILVVRATSFGREKFLILVKNCWLTLKFMSFVKKFIGSENWEVKWSSWEWFYDQQSFRFLLLNISAILFNGKKFQELATKNMSGVNDTILWEGKAKFHWEERQGFVNGLILENPFGFHSLPAMTMSQIKNFRTKDMMRFESSSI